MIRKEYALEDYRIKAKKKRKELGLPKMFSLSSKKREKMIVIIQELHRLKNYKVETLFMASAIADSYLSLLSQLNRRIPDMVQLGVICILMAAKLEEPISPSFNRMINLL